MTQLPRIWLSPPHMCGREQEFIRNAFETNWIAPMGPNVTGFEQDLIDYTGVKHAVVLNSGTAAIHLSLVMLNIKKGDIVICQSLTFSASANPIIYQCATPLFIDSEPDTWNMDPELLENAIIACQEGNFHKLGNGSKHKHLKPQKPKAIIVVHLYGMPAKMDEITKIANKYDVPLIEDAAEALGSRYNGKTCGSFGKMGILSFNGNKIVNTSGGGALISDEEEYTLKARFLATQARDNAPHYEHSNIGYNYRMSNVSAAIGRGQMIVINDRIKARRKNFERYRQYFTKVNKRGYEINLLDEPQGFFSNRWLTTITFEPEKNNNIDREKVRIHLEANNIESRPLWKPMHAQPVFSDSLCVVNGVSEELFDTGLCLPSGSNLSDEDFERIFNTLDQIFI